MTIVSKNEIMDLQKCMYPDLAWEAVKLGLVAGYRLEDGIYLRPNQPITREENWLMDLRQNVLLNTAVLHDIPALVRKVMPSIVRIWNKSSIGSGSFVASDLILTNAHVVENANQVSVDTYDFHPDNGKMQGYVIKRDEDIDLALVRIGKNYKPLQICDTIKQGEFCLVCGNPLGEWHSVSAGIVTRFGGDYLQTDALINPGNSGGAVVNVNGQLIGVPTFKIVTDAVDNHNYSIMPHRIKEFLKGVI